MERKGIRSYWDDKIEVLKPTGAGMLITLLRDVWVDIKTQAHQVIY